MALAMLGAILLITAVWWALALWPTAQATPAWLERTRSVCFGTRPDGLPDGYGWLVLTGQPLALLLILFFGWGRDLRQGFRAASQARAGRAALVFVIIALAIGAGAVGARVRGATSAFAAPANGGVANPTTSTAASGPVMRLDRAAPPLELTDQRGEVVSLEQFRGRPVLVTFAFGNCEAICPTVVRDVLSARRALAEGGTDAATIIVTLDPWRDTPSRLAAIAKRWEMRDDEHLVSGPVEAVEATLDAWEVGRQRDMSTGDIVHPRLIYRVDADGRLVAATSGSAANLTSPILSKARSR